MVFLVYFFLSYVQWCYRKSVGTLLFDYVRQTSCRKYSSLKPKM